MGSNSAGVAPGVTTDNRTQAELDKSLSDTTSAIAVLPLAVGAAVVAPEAALLSGGVNLGAQIIKGEGVSPTEALVSTTMGPIGAAVTEAQAVKALIGQGGKTAITTNASIGAGTNVVGDTTTKVLTGQEVTATGAVTAMGTGAAGANVVSSSKVIPSIATEGLNAVVPIIENVFSNKQGN